MTLNPHTKDLVQPMGTTPRHEEEAPRLDFMPLPKITSEAVKADPCQSVNIDRMKTDHLRINVGEAEDDKKMANSLDHGRKILKQSYRQKKKKKELDNISHLSFDTVAD